MRYEIEPPKGLFTPWCLGLGSIGDNQASSLETVFILHLHALWVNDLSTLAMPIATSPSSERLKSIFNIQSNQLIKMSTQKDFSFQNMQHFLEYIFFCHHFHLSKSLNHQKITGSSNKLNCRTASKNVYHDAVYLKINPPQKYTLLWHLLEN